MLKLYIANKNYSSWSLRPWMVLKELSIAFDEQLVPFEKESSHETFRQFSPTGLVPCLHDDKTVIWESLAIVEYLAESHPPVWPSSKPARAWARSATAEMHAGFSALRTQCSMNCGLRIDMQDISPALQRDLDRLDELFTEGLSLFGGLFLAGDNFTAVDAFFAPVAFRVQTYNLELGEVAMDYVQRILDRPSMREWYTDALSEKWRDLNHDRETLAAGRLITDLRQAV